jgi:hypothetical protein
MSAWVLTGPECRCCVDALLPTIDSQPLLGLSNEGDHGGVGSQRRGACHDCTDRRRDGAREGPGELSRKVLEEQFAVIHAHDVARSVSFYAEDAVVADPEYPEPLRGRGAIERGMTDCLRAFPDLSGRIRSTLIDGPVSGVEATMAGTHEGGAVPARRGEPRHWTPAGVPRGRVQPPGRSRADRGGAPLPRSRGPAGAARAELTARTGTGSWSRTGRLVTGRGLQQEATTCTEKRSSALAPDHVCS